MKSILASGHVKSASENRDRELIKSALAFRNQWAEDAIRMDLEALKKIHAPDGVVRFDNHIYVGTQEIINNFYLRDFSGEREPISIATSRETWNVCQEGMIVVNTLTETLRRRVRATQEVQTLILEDTIVFEKVPDGWVVMALQLSQVPPS
jgi:hypothetical protein